MKKTLLSFSLLVSVSCFSQGWVTGGTNVIYPVNNTLTTSPVSIGVGTSAPTAQFHTTGTLRFQGLTQNNLLTRLLSTDSAGNVFWRDASTFGSSNSWQLTGNTGTNPTTNFLGTTDNQRIVFRTNNTEKMTVLTNGHTGIGINNPQRMLHIYTTVSDNHMAVSGNSPSIRWFAGNNILTSQLTRCGRIGMATGAGDFLSTSAPGDFIIQNIDTAGSLIFGTNQNVNGLERMRLNKVGYLGISTTSPSAKLDVNCIAIAGQTNPSNVRFQNLQSATGDNYLVIDNNGYVYRSTTPVSGRPADVPSAKEKELEAKINTLEKDLQDLRTMIQAQNNSSFLLHTFNFYPNPASSSILIEPITNKNAKNSLIIKDLNGNTVGARITFSDSVQVPISNITPGTYIVTIYNEENKLIDSQKIIIAR